MLWITECFNDVVYTNPGHKNSDRVIFYILGGFMSGILFESYPDVVKPSDVQSMLHIGRNSVYELLRNGKIAAIRVGKKYVIPKSSVIEFLSLHLRTDSGIITGSDEAVLSLEGRAV